MTLTGPLDYSVPRISAPFLPQIRQTRKRTLWVLLIHVPSCLALTICSLVAGTSSPTPLPKLSLGTIINSIHLQVAKAASLAPLASPSALNTRVERRSNLESKRRGPRTTPVLSSKQCTPTESQSWHIHKAYNTLAPSTPTKLKAASDPPRKVRRLSQEHDSPHSTPSAPAGKGKEKEKAPPSASAAANAKQTNDYSAFKGRGRYAKDSKEKTINETFAIDPKHNDGLDFQFDAVVRNKDERRKLHAGDCECCRDVCLCLFLSNELVANDSSYSITKA